MVGLAAGTGENNQPLASALRKGACRRSPRWLVCCERVSQQAFKHAYIYIFFFEHNMTSEFLGIHGAQGSKFVFFHEFSGKNIIKKNNVPSYLYIG